MSAAASEPHRGMPLSTDCADSQLLRALYRQMLLIRSVETLAERLYLQGRASGPFHSAAGQEAVAVGVAAALLPQDYVWGSYRGHHHFLARGGTAVACLAELLGRSGGACRGLGGSMHLMNADHRMMGSYAIVGAQVALACGSAWSARLRNSNEVTVAFCGDGATNIGTFHESLNLAAVWRLPIVFVCENNLYMEYTRTSTVTSVEHPAADRARANGLDVEIVDGNNVAAVLQAATTAVRRARSGAGPCVLEALTYRHSGHAAADPAHYRPKPELEQWLEHDPVLVVEQQLKEQGVTEAELLEIRGGVNTSTEQALAEAEDSVPANLSDAASVWADGSSAWRN